MRAVRRSSLVFALLLLSLQYAFVAPRAAKADAPPTSISAMVARVQPAVVKVISVRRPGKPAETLEPGLAGAAASERPMLANGSGFIIDPSGFVATNKHVVAESIALYVMTNDGVRHPASIVGVTAKADIALIKIDADKPLPTVPFGDSDKMRPGETVVVIGSPLGLDDSVSSGVVSAVNRDIMESPFDDYIQTDAAINHGNSGGPLFNVAGEVIGMNSVLFAPGINTGSVGLGFAIPSNDLRFVFDRMIKTGKVDAGMLPIRTQQIKWMLAQAIGTPGLHGALVIGLDDEGDRMMKGQVKPGDVILTLNGEMVLDPRDLARKAARLQRGSDAALEIFRDGQRTTVHVAIQAWREGQPPVLNDAAPREVGLKLSPGPRGGVLVGAIDPMGSAADSGLQKGDVILQAQAQPVKDPDQVLQVLQAVSASRREFAALLVERDGEQTWIPLAVPK